MSLLKRLLGGDSLSKYEKEQKRRYKQYVKLGTTTTIVSSKSEPEIYQDYLTRIRSLCRSKRKGSKKQNRSERQDDIFKDPTPIGSLSPAPAVLDALNKNIVIRDLPEIYMNDLKELETPNGGMHIQHTQDIELGDNSIHSKQNKPNENIYDIPDISPANTQPLDKKFSYGNQNDFLDQLDEVIRHRNKGQSKQFANQDRSSIQESSQNRNVSISSSRSEDRRSLQTPIYGNVQDQVDGETWNPDESKAMDTATYEYINIPIYNNTQHTEDDMLGIPEVKPRKKSGQRRSLESRGSKKELEGGDNDKRMQQQEESEVEIRVRHDGTVVYQSENEEQYWGTPPDSRARSDSFVTSQSDDSFFDCISDDGDIYDDEEKNIMKQISPHYYKRISYDEPAINYTNTDSDVILDEESLAPPKYSSVIKEEEIKYEQQQKLATDASSNNNTLDDSMEPDSLEVNLGLNGSAIDTQNTHTLTNWAETVRLRERDFTSDEESKEKLHEYEGAQRHDEALVLDENFNPPTPMQNFKGDPEFQKLQHKPRANKTHLIKLENHNDYSDVSIESDRADGKKVTFDFGKSYCQIYEAENSPDDGEILDSLAALTQEGGQVFTPMDNSLYYRLHQTNKLTLNTLDNYEILDDDKSRVFISYGVQPSPPPRASVSNNVFKIPGNMDLAFLNCKDGFDVHVGQHYRPQTSVQIIELSDEESGQHDNEKELETDAIPTDREGNGLPPNMIEGREINQKLKIEDSILQNGNEANLKNNNSPENESETKNQVHQSNPFVHHEIETYQGDNAIEKKVSVDNIHDSQDYNAAACQNSEEFTSMYEDIYIPNSKGNDNNETNDIFLKNYDLTSHVRDEAPAKRTECPENISSKHTSDIPLEENDVTAVNKTNPVVETNQLLNEATNASNISNDFPPQSPWGHSKPTNAETTFYQTNHHSDDSTNLMSLNYSTALEEKSPEAESQYVAKIGTIKDNDLSNIKDTVNNPNTYSTAEYSENMPHVDPPANHDPLRNTQNPFRRASSDGDDHTKTTTNSGISNQPLNGTLPSSFFVRKANVDNTLSSIEESLTEGEKSSITTSDSLEDTDSKPSVPRTFRNPLSRFVPTTTGNVPAKSNEVHSNPNEEAPASNSDKPRVSYSTLLRTASTPVVEEQNQKPAEVIHTGIDSNATNSSEGKHSPLSKSTPDLSKDEVDSGNISEEVRYPKRINLSTSANPRLNRDSPKSPNSPKIFSPKPIFKPRTTKRLGDDREINGDNLPRNEDTKDNILENNDSPRKDIETRPIFKSRTTKRLDENREIIADNLSQNGSTKNVELRKDDSRRKHGKSIPIFKPRALKSLGGNSEINNNKLPQNEDTKNYVLGNDDSRKKSLETTPTFKLRTIKLLGDKSEVNSLPQNEESKSKVSVIGDSRKKSVETIPIFKPRTIKSLHDRSDTNNDNPQNEDTGNSISGNDDAVKEGLETEPIFEPGTTKQDGDNNEVKNIDNLVHSNDTINNATNNDETQKSNPETLLEIKRRLSDVRNIETASKQLDVMQDILLSLKRRADMLASKTDDEYLLLLQTLFKSIRIVSGLECNFDQDLLNSQQKTLKDIQDCMKELNLK